MKELANIIKEKLDLVINEEKFTPLHIPIFEGNEVAYVTNCIESNFVSSVGEYVNKFEKAIEDYTGIKHAILTVNGTAALHISLLLVGVQKEDEVLMPAMTFIATANAISYIGAIPHFVDVDERTLGIDTEKLEKYLSNTCEFRNGECYNKITNKKIKAIVPMHTFGHSVDMDSLVKITSKYNIEVVEDAAESLGSFYKGIHTGSLGKISAISFNGNKIITTGGGGCILTNDDDLAQRAKYITTTSKVPHKWEYVHDEIGYNYRMPALNAALGLAQIEKLSLFIEKKRELAKNYQEAFKEIKEVYFFEEPKYAKSNYWLNAIILKENNKILRDDILTVTNENGIMTRPIWKLMHHLEMFKNCPKMDLTMSESLEDRIINIPSSAYLGE